jgi:hypothetical protein
MPNLRPEKYASVTKNRNALAALQVLSGLLFGCSQNVMVGGEGAAVVAGPLCQKGVVRGFVRNPMIS